MGLNKPVDFTTAKLLKEKGINIYSEYRYTDFNGIERLEKDASEIFPYAPTIAEVVMSLYEKYNLWIFIQRIGNNSNWYYCLHKEIELLEEESEDRYNSPTEAYEAAIKYTLTKLI